MKWCEMLHKILKVRFNVIFHVQTQKFSPKKRRKHFETIHGAKYSRMDQVKFVEDSL